MQCIQEMMGSELGEWMEDRQEGPRSLGTEAPVSRGPCLRTRGGACWDQQCQQTHRIQIAFTSPFLTRLWGQSS